MNQLAFSINGTPIPLPGGVSNLTLDAQGPFGQNIIVTFINLLLVIAVLLSFAFIIFGGLKWITSEGDKQKLSSARSTITFAVIGLVITFVSFLIINLLGQFLHIPLIGGS